ncbi:universal stress protein [Haloplanus salilacus]|uniref:universal stress protein n=1 Tax=Haloplanus salilacus TaxID=2949994 RepID=UPI0030D03C71
MFDTLLVPTDGGDGATAAVDHALELAATHDATVHLLNVADTARDSVTPVRGRVVDVLEREGARIVRDATERATGRGVPIVTDVLQGDPYRTIVEYADTYGVDLVVMATRGRQGLDEFLLGSTTERVLRRSGVPVLTVRPDDERTRYPYRRVLVPTDGSAPAGAALSLGADVATTSGATLHLLSAVETTVPDIDVRADVRLSALEESATAILDDAETAATDAGVTDVSTEVAFGASIAGVTRDHVEDRGIDLVVVGTYGRSGLDRCVLGSVTERLVRTSSVPVLTVGHPDDE